MKKTLGLGLVSLLCCSTFYLSAEETLMPSYTKIFPSLPTISQQKSTLQKMSQDTRNLVQAAFQRDQKKPVDLLVRVVQNPYAAPTPPSKNPDGANTNSNDTTDLSGFLSDPGQAVDNLFSPTVAIGQVGVGLTVHF